MEGTDLSSAFPYLRALKPGAPAFDCIYAPARTPFMARASELGHPAFNGIEMLIYQAIFAYGFFCGEEFDAGTVRELGALLLETSGVDPAGA